MLLFKICQSTSVSFVDDEAAIVLSKGPGESVIDYTDLRTMGKKKSVLLRKRIKLFNAMQAFFFFLIRTDSKQICIVCCMCLMGTFYRRMISELAHLKSEIKQRLQSAHLFSER